MNISQTLECWN